METPELFDPTIPGEKYINQISKLVYIKCISFFLGNNLDGLIDKYKQYYELYD